MSRGKSAPERFVEWLARHKQRDRFGRVYHYHPRSDAHSVALSTYIVEDLLEKCSVLREQGAKQQVAYGINVRHTWPNGKTKTLDLAVGRPETWTDKASAISDLLPSRKFAEVFLSCEAKSVMTEHGKSQPRIFDELSSSHEIVHQGKPEAIAAGITIVNIASTFISPTRNQKSRRGGTEVTKHKQPHVAERMVQHLRGLQIRDETRTPGFDAYCTVVVECDNEELCELWTKAPAPQPGDRDHYATFIDRIARFYTERFGSL